MQTFCYINAKAIRATIHVKHMLHYRTTTLHNRALLYLTFTFVPHSKLKGNIMIVDVKGLIILRCFTLMSTITTMSKMQRHHHLL